MSDHRRISRRAALGALGSVSLGALLAACGEDRVTTTTGATATVEPTSAPAGSVSGLLDDSASCTLTTEQTEGPYYFDVESIRRDIREDRDGTKLTLALRVRDAESCEPIENAVVDVWHCDAAGGYSGFGASEGATYLRGAQVTDRDGVAQFVTIYPGAYPGRTVHIHFKVHLDRTTVLTSQLYFDEALSEAVHRAGPYTASADRDVSNDSDGIFDASLVVNGREQGDGVIAALNLNCRRSAV